MADLNDIQSSQSVKIAGADSAGGESYFANVTPTQDMQTADIVNTSGVYVSLVVGTSPVELKVGGSIHPNRKLATLDNTSNTILYWGYNSSVSTTVYAGRIFKDQNASWSFGANVSIWLIAGSAGNTVRISEAS